MNKLVILIIALLLLTAGGTVLSRYVSQKKQADTQGIQIAASDNLRKATLSIEGMWCASCAVGYEYNL